MASRADTGKSGIARDGRSCHTDGAWTVLVNQTVAVIIIAVPANFGVGTRQNVGNAGPIPAAVRQTDHGTYRTNTQKARITGNHITGSADIAGAVLIDSPVTVIVIPIAADFRLAAWKCSHLTRSPTIARRQTGHLTGTANAR